MNCLAIDCSSSFRSIALSFRQGTVAVSPGETGRTASLLGAVDRLLREAGLARGDVAALHLGLGPGSYTGIRSALALALGWQLARPVSLRGWSSSDACAWVAAARGFQGDIAVVIDAQRDEFYAATYTIQGPGNLRRGTPLRLISRHELAGLASDGIQLLGPDRAVLGPDLASSEIHPEAAALLGMAGAEFGSDAALPLEPIYLRPTAFRKAPPTRVTGMS